MKSGYEIKWTPEAEKSFDAIISYLEEKWTEKEVKKFVQKTFKILSHIKINPEQFQSSKVNNVRKALITKHNSLFYYINEESKIIELYSFWDNRQNPSKLSF
jgi:plasmid stabilization system protein ParE